MKKMKLNEMQKIKGNGPGQDLVGGFLCTAGILTAGTGVGIFLAVVGCSTLFGNWYAVPVNPDSDSTTLTTIH